MGRVLLVCLLCAATVPLTAHEIGWEANGRDVQGTGYSPAAVIGRDNVARLEVAWTYRTGETEERFATAEPTSFEATPLVAEGTMYVGTPLGRVIALDAAAGAELWVFDPQIRRDVRYGDFASRSVSMWVDDESSAGEPCHIVALRASTGARAWSFQTVHHDLRDYDNASPPALVTLVRGGREIPAVLQATKTGMLFVLHRETGEPIFPVEERAVPASRIPGEEASPMTYRLASGEQFVAIAVGGGGAFGAGDHIVAFRLP